MDLHPCWETVIYTCNERDRFSEQGMISDTHLTCEATALEIKARTRTRLAGSTASPTSSANTSKNVTKRTEFCGILPSLFSSVISRRSTDRRCSRSRRPQMMRGRHKNSWKKRNVVIVRWNLLPYKRESGLKRKKEPNAKIEKEYRKVGRINRDYTSYSSFNWKSGVRNRGIFAECLCAMIYRGNLDQANTTSWIWIKTTVRARIEWHMQSEDPRLNFLTTLRSPTTGKTRRLFRE